VFQNHLSQRLLHQSQLLTHQRDQLLAQKSLPLKTKSLLLFPRPSYSSRRLSKVRLSSHNLLRAPQLRHLLRSPKIRKKRLRLGRKKRKSREPERDKSVLFSSQRSSVLSPNPTPWRRQVCAHVKEAPPVYHKSSSKLPR
jgi:hypothetical protein